MCSTDSESVSKLCWKAQYIPQIFMHLQLLHSSSSWSFYFKFRYEDGMLNDIEEVSNECIS